MSYKISTGNSRSSVGPLVMIAVMFFVILSTSVGAFYYFTFGEKPIDPNTLCPARGPVGHVVLLVDKSDPMTFTQKKNFEVIYSEILRKSVKQGYLLSVYALGDDFRATADPIVEICSPGDGTDVSNISSNPEMLKKDFEGKYFKPLMARAGELTTDVPGKVSPILEMIQLASVTGFRKRDIQGERRLIIISDMIHNTSQLIMYRDIPRYEQFSQTDYGRKSLANLDGVQVEIRMLLTAPMTQTQALLKFWRDHISESGGRVVMYEPLL